MEKLICPKCQELKLKSIVRCHDGTITAMGTSDFYDEGGGYHFHNPNIGNNNYSCSNNHSFNIKNKISCPNFNCDYGKNDKPDITINDDLKKGDLYFNSDAATIKKDQS